MKYRNPLLALALLALLVLFVWIWQTPDKPVQLRSEVTRITEPQTDDGFIDYIAALNDRLSDGVDADNNVVVALLPVATVEGALDEQAYRDRFVAALGLEQLPERTDLFVGLHTVAEQQGIDQDELWDDPLGDRLSKAMEGPWRDDQLPLIKSWLDANEKQLEQVKQALSRPRYYHPLVCGGGEPQLMMMVLLPLAQELRNFSRALICRSMNRLANDDVEGCIDDLKAVRLIAARGRQSLTMIEHLVCVAIDTMALTGEAQLIASGKLTAQQCRNYQRFLADLPAGNDLRQCVDLAERFMFLDLMQAVGRDGPAVTAEMLSMVQGVSGLVRNPTAGGDHFKALFVAMSYFVDWNEAMRVGNIWYDRVVEAMDKPNDRRRMAALDELEQQIEGLENSFQFRPSTILAILAGPKSRGRMTGKWFLAMLLPATEQVVAADVRAKMGRQLAQVGFALGAYRADHEGYPTTLAAIVPQYIDQLPSDRYTDQALVYKAQRDRFLLYSLGANQKDDGGRFYDSDIPGSDDIPLKVNWEWQAQPADR